MLLHRYDCEVYTLADALNDMLRFEEKLETITTRETSQEFGLLMDALIEAVADVNHHISDLTDEARHYMYESERVDDELYYARNELDDLREEISDFKDGLRRFLDG